MDTVRGYMGAQKGEATGGPPCGCAASRPPAPHAGSRGGSGGVGRTRNLNRLRRIEGQIRGLQHMVEGDRTCADILMQMAAVQEALRAVSRELLRNHLRHCITRTVADGTGREEAMYDELVRLFDKHA
jgi:DNA-binding FrmR family transcriptional regulator